MRFLVSLAPVAVVLAACVPVTDKLSEPGPGAGKPGTTKQTLIVTDADEGKNQGKGCELKNPSGTGACDDGSGAYHKQKKQIEAEQTIVAMQDGFASMCAARKDKLSPEIRAEYVTILNEEGPEAANAYCAYAPLDIVKVEPEPVQSTPVSSGGGCEWKGRNYSPGDSIHYQSDGQILSSDLFVFGKNFGNLSGKSGPWQLCECSTSSGHWGCV